MWHCQAQKYLLRERIRMTIENLDRQAYIEASEYPFLGLAENEIRIGETKIT